MKRGARIRIAAPIVAREPCPFTIEHWRRAVGFILRSWRRASRVSQQEVAAQLGMDRSHLARLELGHYEPGSYRLVTLILWYGRTIDEGLGVIARRAEFYSRRAK